MANRKQRRHAGKPHGMSYADRLAQQRLNREAAQNAANDVMVEIKADIKAEKAQWLLLLTLNDTDHFGKTRYDRLALGLIERSKWYEKMVAENDEDYAYDKLRQELERVTRQEIDFAWDDRIRAAQKRCENDIMTHFERLRSCKPVLAEFICRHTECHICPGQPFCKPTGVKGNGLVEWLDQMEEAGEGQ